MSSKVTTIGWRYARYGPIVNVLKCEKFDVLPKKGDAVVRMLIAPLHRTDAAVINGTGVGWMKSCKGLSYNEFPRVGGLEGVGRVVRCRNGDGCSVKEGDVVWIAPSLQGTWANEVIVSDKLIHTINPKYSGIACTASNALMAERLLYGYRALTSGDVVIQNCGSSLTALIVSALAQKQLPGVTVLTTASPGERFTEAVARHAKYGSEVFEYSSSGYKCVKERMGDARASLFLNGMGGTQFDNFLKLMRHGGSDAVCYGAQNGAGLFFSGSNLIFPEVSIHGFYLPTYFFSLSYNERQVKLESVLDTLAAADFSYPTVTVNSLESLPEVWDSTFVQGGKKGMVSFQ